MTAHPVSLPFHDGGWLIAKQVNYEAGFQLPWHQHDDACVQIVLEGSFAESGWREHERIRTGEAVFRPLGFPHANPPSDESSTGLSIQLSTTRMPEPVADFLSSAIQTRILDPYVSTLAIRISRELTNADNLSPHVIEALCIEIVAFLLRASKNIDKRSVSSALVERAAKMIHHSLSELLSVEWISAELGVDRFQLNRAFLKHRGCSPAEFIRLARVEAAQRLLLQTSHPIAYIANECGFADQSHMTKAFKLLVGISPSKFRIHRESDS